jgi:Fe-S-cluster-containing hydrogenase component 2
VFQLQERRALIVDKDLCIECGGCANNCEFDAIDVRSGVGCAAAVMQSLVKGGEAECGCCDSP